MEQTPTTYVYILSAGDAPIKIGVSDNPEKRLADLQTAHYLRLHLLFAIACKTRADAFRLEKALHWYFAEERLINEWFNITAKEVEEKIEILLAVAESIEVNGRHLTLDGKLPKNQSMVRERPFALSVVNAKYRMLIEREGLGFVAVCPHCQTTTPHRSSMSLAVQELVRHLDNEHWDLGGSSPFHDGDWPMILRDVFEEVVVTKYQIALSRNWKNRHNPN